MRISRKKFVILFIACGFAFLFVTSSLLGSTGFRVFPKAPDSLLGIDSPVTWKHTVSIIISPIKIVLLGPLVLPSIDILKEDPPPPFIVIYLVCYWAILASAVHYLLGRYRCVS